MYKLNYAGVELSDAFIIEKINRQLTAPRENHKKEIPSLNGSHYLGYRFQERVFEIELAFTYSNLKEYTDKLRYLANVLNVANPSKLILGDEPDKFYYAVIDGDMDVEKLFNKGARITLTFICHDPIAYSLNWKTFTPNSQGIVTINNQGTYDTNIIVEADFQNSACFFQITNHLGETVLIGQPKDSVKPTLPLTDRVVNDECSDSTSFTTLSESLLDKNRLADGQLGIGYNGWGVVATNYGNGSEEDKWHGGTLKKNLNANLSEFEVQIDLIFTSEGKNYYVPPTPPVPPPPPTPENPNPPTTNTYGTYQVVNCGGLWINREANTKYPLFAMSPNTKIYPTEINGKWYKHTHKTKTGSYTGWSYGRYLKKISDKVVKSNNEETQFAEDEVGILEVYGFDQNGGKLFKMEVSDTNEFYEYVEPKVFIGDKLVLDDGKNCPIPRKINIKDDDGKITGEREVESGTFGEWNDLWGKIVIRREKNEAGNYLWSASVYKFQDSKIVNTMFSSNAISSDAFLKTDLNYLGFYIGKFGKHREVDLVAIDHIEVRRLNQNNNNLVESNLEIFKAGDHIQVDFAEGLVKLNDQIFLESIDIGSEFFKTESGQTQVAIRTDDRDSKVLVGIQETFI